MLVYSVTVEIDAATEAEWLAWMSQVHIPDVLATGRFRGAGLRRVVEPEPGSGRAAYVIDYDLESLAELEAYRAGDAARLQAEHSRRYAGRFTASRRILESVRDYEGPAT